MGKLFLAALILVAATAAACLSADALKVGLELDHAQTVVGLVCWAFVALTCAIALASSALSDARCSAYKLGQQDAIRPKNLCRLQREQYAAEEAEPSPM